MTPKRDWLDMTWAEIAAGDPHDWIAVLPVAAVEQHGPHLPLGTDAYIAQAYLSRVHAALPDDLPVTFLPVQKIGHSPEHSAFPGTLTLSASTVIAAWKEIGASLHRCGLRKLVIVSSHGGNLEAIDLVARDLRLHLKMLAVTCAWGRFGYPPGAFDPNEIDHGIHGGDIETSIMLAYRADLVARQKAAAATPATIGMAQQFKWLGAFEPAGFGWLSQDLHPSGAIGDATHASAEKGERALVHGAQAFIELLQDVHRFDLKQLRSGPLDVPDQI